MLLQWNQEQLQTGFHSRKLLQKMFFFRFRLSWIFDKTINLQGRENNLSVTGKHKEKEQNNQAVVSQYFTVVYRSAALGWFSFGFLFSLLFSGGSQFIQLQQ